MQSGPAATSGLNPKSSVTEAQQYPLRQNIFYSVEYPGYVQPSSVPLAIKSLGGQANLEAAFRRTPAAASSAATSTPSNTGFLELHLRPDNPFAHPVAGGIVNTNKVLLKVIKRRRKRPLGSYSLIGDYTIQVEGVVPKTARWRSMSDYQYQPVETDPVFALRMAMERMDVEAIRKYVVPDSTEEYAEDPQVPELSIDPALQEPAVSGMQSNLRLFPPPIFGRQTIPQVYSFKSNPTSMVSTTVDEETGEEKKRMINKMRWKGYGPSSVSIFDTTIPEKPAQAIEDLRGQANVSHLHQLVSLFETRPAWTRVALLNQFDAATAREIVNSKALLPLVCYVFQDGPWRDTLIRFGWDPRKDVSGRFYQRVYLRNANHPMSRPSVVTRRQQGGSTQPVLLSDVDPRRSHIFDGHTLSKETAAFQLCDIEDGLLKGLVETEDVRDSCNERDGWYLSETLDRIRAVLRYKFFALLDGHPATDEECMELLGKSVDSGVMKINASRTGKLRPGKHNMAKGAMRPEDATAMRLRASLDQKVREGVMAKRS